MVHAGCGGKQKHWGQRSGEGSRACTTPPLPHQKPGRATRNWETRIVPPTVQREMWASLCLRVIKCQVAREPPHVSKAEAGLEQVSAEPDRGGTGDEAQEETLEDPHSGTTQQEPLRGRPVTVGQDLERKIKDKGGDGEGDAGADHLGGATMATTRKFQPPGMGGQVEQTVPKELLNPFRTQKLQGCPGSIPSPDF